jgi:hypothetical protein
VKKAYRAKAYDTVTLTIPKGMRDTYKKYAKELGISMVQLIQTAANEYILERFPDAELRSTDENPYM